MLRQDHLNRAGYTSPRSTADPQSVGLLPRLRDAIRSWLAVDSPASTAAGQVAVEAPAVAQDWPSLDEIYDEVKDSVAAQNDRLKTIDTKANFGLAAATLLTAGVTGLGRALVDAGQRAIVPSWTVLGIQLRADQVIDWVTIASLGIYGLVALSAYAAYRLRTFKEAPDPNRLVAMYIHVDPRITKATITSERAKNYAINEKKIGRKAWWTNLAMVFLILEAFLLFIIALIQVTWL